VTVNFETDPSYIQKVTTQLLAGAGPDVVSVNWDMLRTFSQYNYLYDLTPEASKDKAFAADLGAYHPKIAALMKWDGKQKGVALDHDDIAIYWNVSLFKRLQLRPLTDVQDKWTWDDTLDIARKITDRSANQYGFYGLNTTGQTGYWSIVYANGGNVITDDGTKADPLLDPASIEAIQWLTDLRVKHGVTPTDAEARAAVGSTSPQTLFQNGKLGMMIDGSWRTNTFITSIKDFEWDVAHIPLAPRTGKRSSVVHGTGFGVNKDGHAVDAAVAFIKHLATRETHHVYGSTGIIQSARMDEWDGFYANPKPPAHRSVLKAAVDYAHQHPLTGQWGIIVYDAIIPVRDALAKVYTGEVPVKDGLQGGVKAYNQLMADQVAKINSAKK
jgi:ABC-type glycerol-3-phosphate transport system substrate-binding protein